MEAGSSDGEKKPPESGGGEPKVKRKMKTAAQLEVLENTYKVETYPSEAVRADLSVQLGLSDRQLQMWFCHRRLKDRKPPPASTSTSAKRARKDEVSPMAVATSVGGAATSLLPPPVAGKDVMLGLEFRNNENGSGSGSSPDRYMEPKRRGGYGPRTGVAVPRISGHVRYYEPPPQPVAELRAIAFVEAQLGEPLRDDGPALGMEFDPLPPGAFGAPIEAPQVPTGRSYETSIYEHSDSKSFKGSGRALHEYQFLPEQPTVRSDSYERSQSHYYGSPPNGPATKTPPLASGRSYMHNYEEVPVRYGTSNHLPSLSLMSQPGKMGPSSVGEYGSIGRKPPYMAVDLESPYNAHPTTGLEDALIPSERRITQEDEVVRVERKRKSDDARLAREMEANEKKMRKELERQDILRRKREELMRKEMERIDRERRKEEERVLREKQREEERYQKEQRREMERREKILLKESIRAEKMRQKEELRREREAVRQKAANDRAVARRLAKESMELIEDERLELMEIAASRKSFPSIVSLDSETLQNLDSYRDMLRVFPPKSVQRKKPFAMQPWLDSEEHVGNLLMVWRFLITFADVLGLWPFTLDEFVQAFHDYDPRLLGEIHLALLRTIIKDIEDVARTPSTGLGVNQNNVANPGGGHPHIVEGAYAWGFDICSWQNNLNLLTWQEILRQFALSAGFGPKLMKRKTDQAYPPDDSEGDDGVNVISNLRTGAAVESAVAIMREKGYSNPRRSRHRMTPGTVKFAAFHVLSFEGSRGLNILDVADKIQNSGLRDLTTSKTPEASIAAALSRDTKIFERTAPSTYCVRSPYRKDPIDAEAILAEAREKIRVFKSGFLEGVEEADVDEVEPDEVEKDDDSESDDPEVDDLAPNKDSKVPYDLNLCGPKDCLNDGIGNLPASNVAASLSSIHLQGFNELDDSIKSLEETSHTNHEDTGVDESFPGEPWVQGLMDGEYSNLSVEERLNALVSLIGVATEGNSIRVVLEERLEAATALKKQMWAEAQLDKRRLKEEYLIKPSYAACTPNTTDIKMIISSSLASDENNETVKPFHDPNNDSYAYADTPDLSAVYAAERSRALMKSYIGHKAEEMYVHRSLPLGQDRRRNRYWQFVASASSNDPGTGRVFVEMHNGGGWKLIDSEEDFDALVSSLDVRGVRESHLHALLRKVEPLFRESARTNKLDTNANGLSCSSVKTEDSEIPSNPESSNHTICAPNSETPEPSTSFHLESGKNSLEIKNALKRYKKFEDWIWRECMSSSVLRVIKYGKKRCAQLVDMCDSCHDVYYFEDNHCSTCHKTFTAFDKSFNFSDHVIQCEETKASIERKFHHFDYPPARIRLLKVVLALVEACILPEALQTSWSDTYRKLWGMKLHMSSSAEDLLQVVTLLEGATKRDFMSSNFQTTSELLVSGNVVGSVVNDAFNFGTVTVLPWIPQTTSAVALRLMDLDSAMSYLPDQRETEKDREANHFIKLPSESQEGEFAASHSEHQHKAILLDEETQHLGFASTRGGRGGRGRGLNRGGRSQRRQGEPRLGQAIGVLKVRNSRGKGGRKRGRRSVRSRQRPVKKTAPTIKAEPVEPLIFNSSPPGFSGRNVWNEPEENTMMQVDDNNDSNFERSEYEDDDEVQDEYDDYPPGVIDRGEFNMDDDDRGEFNMDDDEDEDEDDEEVVVGDELDANGGEYEQGDEDVGGYLNADSDEEDRGNGGQDRDRNDEDETSDSGSSDYSSD